MENAREVKEVARQLDLNFSQFADVSREYQTVRANKEDVELAMLFLMDTSTSERQDTLKAVMKQMPRKGFLGIGKRVPVLDAEPPDARRLKKAGGGANIANGALAANQKLVPMKIPHGFIKSDTGMLPVEIVDLSRKISVAGPREKEVLLRSISEKFVSYLKLKTTIISEDDFRILDYATGLMPKGFASDNETMKLILGKLDSAPSANFYYFIQNQQQRYRPGWEAKERIADLFYELYPEQFSPDGPRK